MSEDSIERDGIKWGAEIAVDGKRPEWLQLEQLCMAQSDFTGEWYQNSKAQPASEWGFSSISAIRLPADHSYYAQEKAENAQTDGHLYAESQGYMVTRMAKELNEAKQRNAELSAKLAAQAAATSAIDPALVERMKSLVNHAALNASGYTQQEASSILTDMLPNPARKFKDDNPNWVILDRAELIERVLAWKETNA